MNATMLIVDDETTIRSRLRYQFEQLGWEVAEAANGAQGLEAAASAAPDVVLLDVKLGDMSGLDVLDRIRQSSPASVVLMMTAHGGLEMALDAVRNRGAWWFFQKPVDTNLLEVQVAKALEHARALRRERLASDRTELLADADLGQSDAIREVERLVDVLAGSPDTTVLLLGESGTGKGLTASLLHRRSSRRDQPFQEINCAGLSETFLESELFGAERGAYTDAKALKRGLLEIADGGTVFLDEIGDLAPALQPKLLKVLEAKRFRRLGGVKDLAVDVRLVAATNRDLKRMVEEGKFREDLYYRLNVMAIRMPPLRDRGRDVLLLAQRFIDQFNRSLGRRVEGFTPEAQALLLAHAWPGNVRELRNVVERGMILCREGRIGREHLPPEVASSAGASGLAPAPAGASPVVAASSTVPAPVTVAPAVAPDAPLLTLEELERQYIADVLHRLEDNRSRSAQALGISRSTLIEKIKKYGLGAG